MNDITSFLTEWRIWIALIATVVALKILNYYFGSTKGS